MNESDDNGKGWRPAIWEILLLSIAVFSLVLAIFKASGLTVTGIQDVLGIIAVGGGSVGLILAALRTNAMNEQNRLTQQSLELNTKTEANTRLAKAFTDAINQLGNKDNKHTRAGGAHALGKIALEDWRRAKTEKGYESAYYNTCIDILSGFLRSRCEDESGERRKDENGEKNGELVWKSKRYRLPVDIEAALVTVSACNETTRAAHPIDLHGVDLRCWKGLLPPLNLERAFLGRTDFRGVHLIDCSLRGAKLSRADLRAMIIESCDLDEAGLFGAKTQNTQFISTQLPRAQKMPRPRNGRFSFCDLSGGAIDFAKYSSTEAQCCDLSGTKLLCRGMSLVDIQLDVGACFASASDPPKVFPTSSLMTPEAIGIELLAEDQYKHRVLQLIPSY